MSDQYRFIDFSLAKFYRPHSRSAAHAGLCCYIKSAVNHCHDIEYRLKQKASMSILSNRKFEAEIALEGWEVGSPAPRRRAATRPTYVLTENLS